MKMLLAAFTSMCVMLASVKALGSAAEGIVKPLEPMSVHEYTTREIVDQLDEKHYVKATMNDTLSEKVFDKYLENLDPQKHYLIQSDIDSFEVYRHKIDDALIRGDLEPAFLIWNVYQKRLTSRFEKVIAFLEEGIDNLDFTKHEELLLDRRDHPWASTEEELDASWRKRIKEEVLNLKLTGKEPDKIQELLLKRYKNRLGLTRQTKSEEVYQLYINSFTETYDPHTQYYSPRSTENFNISMSLSLEGIGAVLQQEEEFTKVVSLVPAGPADKSKMLKPNDKIIGVGQEQNEIVDVIGWRLGDVVQLIRGKKNTMVWLDIIPAGLEVSESKVIQITRNTVKLEEQAAKSEVIELEQLGQTHQIGVITVPAFYADFKAFQAGDRNYRSTTRDVRKLLQDLKKEDVSGVIIDLRNNGGVSLTEAKQMTGLFIEQGPIVQIRYKSNRVELLTDKNPDTVYDGPLVVMVNRLSASASEIFAGAIQDYQRGIIIGSRTFGKGTVQTIVPLSRGQLKLTQMKFYRISGESNQHKGIIPDILYPANFDPETIGESSLDDPLPWDTIRATMYRKMALTGHLVPDLRNLHEARIKSDPEFIYAQELIAYQQQLADAEILSLNEQKRIEEKDKTERFLLTLENKKRTAQGLKTIMSLNELDENHQSVGEASPHIFSEDELLRNDNPNHYTVQEGDTLWDIAGMFLTDSLMWPEIWHINPHIEKPHLIYPGNELVINYIDSQSELSLHREDKSNEAEDSIKNKKSATTIVADNVIAPTEKNASEQEANEIYTPDAFVSESGNILLDLITLQKISASEHHKATANDTYRADSLALTPH